MFSFISLMVWFVFGVISYIVLFCAIMYAGAFICLFIFGFAKEVYCKLKERYEDQTRSIFKKK